MELVSYPPHPLSFPRLRATVPPHPWGNGSQGTPFWWGMTWGAKTTGVREGYLSPPSSAGLAPNIPNVM